LRGAAGGAIRQHVDDLSSLQVHDQRSVATPLDPAPVINPSHSKDWSCAGTGSLAFEVPQYGIIARRHAQPHHEALCRPSAGGVAEQPNQFCHTGGSSCMGRRYPRRQLRKRPLLALWIAALPPRHLDAEHHDCPLFWQILKLSIVVAMAGSRWNGTAWTCTRVLTNGRNQPFSAKMFDVQDPRARARRPLCFAFHSP
jgi:hypothetical protein